MALWRLVLLLSVAIRQALAHGFLYDPPARNLLSRWEDDVSSKEWIPHEVRGGGAGCLRDGARLQCLGLSVAWC